MYVVSSKYDTSSWISNEAITLTTFILYLNFYVKYGCVMGPLALRNK